MKDRGIKKWAPYKSLREQYTDLDEMFDNRRKVSKPLISSDKAEEINAILTSYQGEEINITYYEDGYIKEVVSRVRKIDVYSRVLYLVNYMTISFASLLNIEQI